MAKIKVVEMDDGSRRVSSVSLEKQGQMMSNILTDAAPLWARVVQSLLPEQVKFALNAAVDTLPHNSNLHLWKESNACPLCRDKQTLIHVLNCCSVARDLRGYNSRHDQVLLDIADTIKKYVQPTLSITVDLDSDYAFPALIVSTGLRPDIV